MGYRTSVLLSLALALAGAATARAQDAREYLSNRNFEIPFSLDPGRPIKQVILYSSTDGKNYAQSTVVKPDATHFDFHATADGWHYFVVQTEDNAGTKYPPNPNAVAPAMRVHIDTVPPKIETFHAVRAEKEGQVAVEWVVSDANLDLRTLKLAYKASDTEWMSLNPEKLDKAHFAWTPRGTAPYDVRLTVSDLARNPGQAALKLGTGELGAGKTPAEGGGAPAKEAAPVHHVKTRTFNLNYTLEKAGSSGIRAVEVWRTDERKTTWTKIADAGEKGPYQAKATREGRYGYTLRPISGVGRGPKPPSIGQDPQVWIEVDETPPAVRINDVQLAEKDGGTLTVRYIATDKFLRAKPISILVSPKRDGEYRAVVGQQDLENKGVVQFNTVDLPAEFFVKVAALDEAGNEGWAIWSESVKNDPHLPKLKIDGVSGVETPAAPGTPKTETPMDAGYTPRPAIGVTPVDPAPAPKAPVPSPAPVPPPVAPSSPPTVPAPMTGGPPGDLPPPLPSGGLPGLPGL